jgi:hypothetical protein
LARTAYQSKGLENYRLLIHDEGEPLLRQSWPPTVAGLKEATVKDIRDHPIDVFSYGVNAACGAYHPSKVYDRMGDDVELHRETGTWKIVETNRRLEAQGLDPTAIIIEACHEIGMDVNIRIRMNDLHDAAGYYRSWHDPDKPPKPIREAGWYYMAKFKKDHPEFLLGKPQPKPGNREEFEAYALNYALAPVRQRQYRFIEETVNGYDLDALTLDFMRFPYLFKKQEAYGQRHLFTDYMKRIRTCIGEAADRRGRPIYVGARLPDTIDLALRMGIDINAWLAEGILDFVIIGAGYNSFGVPWEDIGGAARRAGAHVIGTVRSMGMPPAYEGDKKELYYRQIRAAAIRAYDRGVAGFELFNYFYHMPFYGSVHGPGGGTGYAFTADMREPHRLRSLPHTYEASREVRVDYIYGHAVSKGQLPCTIGRSEDGLAHTFTIDVAERIPRGAKVKLWLQLIDLWHEHELDIAWNGKPLPFHVERDWHRKGSLNAGEISLPLKPADIKEGENRLSLKLVKRPANLDHFITLNWAMLHIDPT